MKYLKFLQVERDVQYVHHAKSTLDLFDDYSISKATDLKFRIQEMLRIKGNIPHSRINVFNLY